MPESLPDRLKRPGDNDSWRECYEIYAPLIYNRARQRGLSVADADDVVQKTMTDLARRVLKVTFDPRRCAFKTWVMGIARWKIAEHFRKQGVLDRIRRGLENSSGANWPSNTPDIHWEDDPRLLVAHEAFKRVSGRSSKRAFEIFCLCTMEGNRPASVAKFLRATVNTVYICNRRIRNLIQLEARGLKKAGFEAADW